MYKGACQASFLIPSLSWCMTSAEEISEILNQQRVPIFGSKNPALGPMTLIVYVWQKNFQSQIVKRRHSKHFAFRCLLEFRNLADFKDSEIPIIDWGALSLTNIFLTCIPVYILYIYICLYLIYNPRSDLTTITWQGLAQLLRRWLRHWEFGRGTPRLDELYNL